MPHTILDLKLLKSTCMLPAPKISLRIRHLSWLPESKRYHDRSQSFGLFFDMHNAGQHSWLTCAGGERNPVLQESFSSVQKLQDFRSAINLVKRRVSFNLNYRAMGKKGWEELEHLVVKVRAVLISTLSTTFSRQLVSRFLRQGKVLLTGSTPASWSDRICVSFYDLVYSPTKVVRHIRMLLPILAAQSEKLDVYFLHFTALLNAFCVQTCHAEIVAFDTFELHSSLLRDLSEKLEV